MEDILTLQKLKDMPEHKMFATGTIVDSPKGINMTNSGKILRWVACRGIIHDWAIYMHQEDKDVAWIHNNGDKVYNRENVKKLVPCDKEALEMYRD